MSELSCVAAVDVEGALYLLPPFLNGGISNILETTCDIVKRGATDGVELVGIVVEGTTFGEEDPLS